jgi:hypothetical protein
MSRFDLVVERNFFVMGEDATYTPAGGDPLSIKVMPRRPDEILGIGETMIVTGTDIFDVRAADITQPAEGDTLIYKGKTYIVQGEPQTRDPDRLIWTLNTRAA